MVAQILGGIEWNSIPQNPGFSQRNNDRRQGRRREACGGKPPRPHFLVAEPDDFCINGPAPGASGARKLKSAGTGWSAPGPGIELERKEMNFDMQSYLKSVQVWLQDHGLKIILIVVLTFVLLKIATLLTDRLKALLARRGGDLEYEKRSGTLSGVVHWLLRLVILSVAAFMLLSELGVPVAPILTAAGVVGLAVGFGAQNLVQDFISGFFILLEDQVRVGDVVQIGDKSGLVERVTLRMVILRDQAGSVHFIRNGKIDVVTNMTKDFSHYVFDLGVAYREDVDEVIRVLKGIDEGMRQDPDFKNDILAPLEVLGLDSFSDSAVMIKARTKTKPIQQWRVGREFNRRIKKKFDELNIEIPFPHQTIYFGKDKAGGSPPLTIETKQAP
jgi:moderate conductance mechanosensitive channel